MLAIYFIALFARLYMLGSIPFGLHEDEMMNGYVGRYILQNGRDLYNNKWPLLYFDNFGDYPNVIPMYLSGFFTYIFGATAFAIRFPIAVIGALTVFPIYALAQLIFQKKKLALLAALFLAIMPWHIVLSRSTAENVTATFVFLCGLIALFLYHKSTQRKHLLATVGLFASTYLLYPSYRVIVPIAMLFSVALFWKHKKARLYLFVVATCFFALTFCIGRTVWGQGRFKQTSIFSFNHAVDGRLMNFQYDEGENQVSRARIFHNKLIGYSREFIRQYISYFSPNYLFTDGGKPFRYKVDDSGLLYIGFLVIMAIGIGVDIFGNKQQKDNATLFSQGGKEFLFFVILILGLSVVPSALTLDDVPNVHRTIAMGVFLVFPIAYCVGKIEKLAILGKICLAGVTLLIVGESIYFWHQFGVHAPTAQTLARGDDRTVLAHYIIEHQHEYDKIFLPRDAKALYFLFYSNNFDASLAGTFTSNIMMPGFDNIVFIDDNCVTGFKNLALTGKSLIVDRAECLTVPGFSTKTILVRSDKTPSFRVQTFVGSSPSKK